MCELFGMSSAREKDIKALLNSFYAHSIDHPHGWGLMTSDRRVTREPVCAIHSSTLAEKLKTLQPQKNVLAHIRFATVGALKLENCHPYSESDVSGRIWTLIHNGTIYSGGFLANYLSLQKGDTDSERVFLYMMDKLNENINALHRELLPTERFSVIDELVTAISPRNKLNLIIFDGEFMYVHKNMMETLFYKSDDDSVIVSTHPLDDDGWAPVPATQLIVFKNKEIVFKGTHHNNVFVPTLEYISAGDAMHI